MMRQHLYQDLKNLLHNVIVHCSYQFVKEMIEKYPVVVNDEIIEWLIQRRFDDLVIYYLDRSGDAFDRRNLFVSTLLSGSMAALDHLRNRYPRILTQTMVDDVIYDREPDVIYDHLRSLGFLVDASRS